MYFYFRTYTIYECRTDHESPGWVQIGGHIQYVPSDRQNHAPFGANTVNHQRRQEHGGEHHACIK